MLRPPGCLASPQATVSAKGTLLDAPLSLELSAERTSGILHATISQLAWKSLQAEAALDLAPNAVLPEGTLRLNLARLADLQPLLGRPVAGQLAVTLDSNDQAAKLAVKVQDASVPGTASISKALLNATVTNPTGHFAVDGTLTADGVSAGPAKGVSARRHRQGSAGCAGADRCGQRS